MRNQGLPDSVLDALSASAFATHGRNSGQKPTTTVKGDRRQSALCYIQPAEGAKRQAQQPGDLVEAWEASKQRKEKWRSSVVIRSTVFCCVFLLAALGTE
jgi:hypothetical protein